jgi:hypothetical protein
MARIMGKTSEADEWDESAAAIRKLILDRLYVPEDASFYDLDSNNEFVRIRGDAMIRVLGEHVVDPQLFETIYRKQVHNPAAFWAPYPLPSIALDDPAFVRPIPRNSWGGASQALEALRATRWMEFYGKPADLAHLMDRWVDAIVRSGDFYQQLDPLTGEATKVGDPGGYSPAALVLLDFVWRLYGVRRDGDRIEWNCRQSANATKSVASIKTTRGTAELQHASDGSALESRTNAPKCAYRGPAEKTTRSTYRRMRRKRSNNLNSHPILPRDQLRLPTANSRNLRASPVASRSRRSSRLEFRGRPSGNRWDKSGPHFRA